MVDLRPWFYGLIVALAVSTSARAQTSPFQCIANAGTPRLVRAEGRTEGLGDVTLNCFGGTPTAVGLPVPQVNIQIFLSTSVTSRLLTSNATGPNFSEALLIIDEPNSAANPARPVLNCGAAGAPDTGPGPGVCAIISTGNPAATYDGTPGVGAAYGVGRPNVFQAREAITCVGCATNSLIWLGVPLDPPGLMTNRTLRITNVHANAAGIGVSSTFLASPIQIDISVSGNTSVAINNPQQIVAYVQRGLLVDTSSLSTPSSSVRFQEGFASSWRAKNLTEFLANGTFVSGTFGGFSQYKGGLEGHSTVSGDTVQNVPDSSYNTESGFEYNAANVVPSPNPPPGFAFRPVSNNGAPLNSAGLGGLDTGIKNAGVADAGTRLALHFTGVPNGAAVLLPTVVYLSRQGTTCQTNPTQFQPGCSTGVMVLTNTDADGAGPFNPVVGTTVPVGSLAVYEILYADPFSLEYVDVPCQLTTGQSLPAAGVTVTGTFAPFYTDAGAAQPLPSAIPRFGPATDCTYSLSPPSQVFDASGGGGSVAVLTQLGCGWAVASDQPWITFFGPEGSSGVDYTILANTTGMDRSGTIALSPTTAAGQTVTITQRGTVQRFGDVAPAAFFFDAVNMLYQHSVTAGCSTAPLLYCPDSNVTRGQMAVFITRAVLGGDPVSYTQTPFFTDVPSSHPFFKWIQTLRDLNITAGCGPQLYCPDNSVTRDQMAVFIIRARYGASATFSYPSTPYFGDVSSSNAFFSWIQKMAQVGITAGCGPQVYCPSNPVTRGQMAIFIMRGAFNQLLPVGTPVISMASPAAVTHGQTVNVTLTGVNTNFVQGTTQVSAGAGITVNSVTVVNGQSLTANLIVAAGAALGPRSLVASTGAEEAVLPNGLIVQ